MSLMQSVEGYYRLFGLHGVLAISGRRLIGHPHTIGVVPPNTEYPVRLRLRTSDVSLYSDVLVGQGYDIPLATDASTIVDLGANIGLTAIFYACKYPKAKVIAVEAEASNYDLMLENIAPYPNIVPIHAAIWDKDGTIGVGGSAHGKWGFVVGEQELEEQVRAVSIPTLMREAGITSIDILKVNIEGAEKELFESSSSWIGKVNVVVVDLHEYLKPGCESAVSAALAGWTRGEYGGLVYYSQNKHA